MTPIHYTGKAAENAHIKQFNSIKLSDYIDMFAHIDVVLPDGLAVEIKGAKQLYRRRDGLFIPDYDVMIIESMNKRGNPGWVAGYADVIDFVYKGTSWLRVPRMELFKIGQTIPTDVDPEVGFPLKPVNRAKLEMKKLYKRTTGKDLVFHLKTEEVLQLPGVKIIPFKNDD